MKVLKTEELLKKEPYSYSNIEKNAGGIFFEALLEELCFHYENNEKYRKFCENKDFDPRGFQGDLSEIPAVQVSVFKEMGKNLSSVPKDQIKLTLQSSATSGVPSSVPVDRVTSKRQAKAMVRVVSEFIGNERKPFLVMDVDPSLGFREMLGARFAAVSGYLNFASDVGYFLKINDERRYYFDVDGIQEYISSIGAKQSAIVFGFTYILYTEVIKPLTASGIKFQLPENSKMLHIGGWKKLEQEKISKAEFNQRAAELFGIEAEDVIDVYGFTEQMGLNYPNCKCGCKHTSLYSEVIVRDVITKEVLPPGEEGLLEFLSPVPHSYPGNVVLTDDIGMVEKEECPYHRAGTRFRVLGRLKKAEVRGCGDILSEKLKFAGSVDSGHRQGGESKFKVEFYTAGSITEGISPEETLKEITVGLRSQLAWLRSQPVDALIGLISKTAEKWKVMDQQSGLENLNMNGLGFLGVWCTPEHLVSLMTEGLNGNRMYVDTFIPVSDSNLQYRKAVSRGLVCHWLAGNVQVLGMFALIESILTKNVNLLKLSSRDGGVFCTLLSAFEGETYITPGGYSISGDDLLNTIAVVYYGHTDECLGRLMSAEADVRVAWGSGDAVTAVVNFPSKYDCEDIIMGPKLSFAAVSKEAILDERKVKKLARKIAVDASVFDQTGCASTHNVFVERGGNISPEQFAAYLAEGMKKTAMQIPKGVMAAEQVSAIHSVRGVYDFKGKVYGDSDAVWTVLYSEDKELNKPVYSRVVFVHPVDDLMETLEFVDDNIQTIGLAADGEKAISFALAAADRGAMRFPACGRMLHFDSPWDGMYLTDRLVRWVTIGGPLV